MHPAQPRPRFRPLGLRPPGPLVRRAGLRLGLLGPRERRLKECLGVAGPPFRGSDARACASACSARASAA
ncbi:hypothetical protein [Methylobacterium oryzae]|uniref:hypothetical protein n=1 Tax=Methylobacterium oryzae TaxID=334852 RepID=UPI002F351182